MSNHVQILGGADRKSMVDYLVHRKHPNMSIDRIARKEELSSRGLSLRTLEVLKFREELEAMAPSELQSLYHAEWAVAVEELRKKAEAEEAARSWNQAWVRTKYDFWSKAASWTLDEATGLTLGRDPHHVTWEKLKSCTDVSPFARKYERQRDLVLRAKGMGQLFEPVIPTIFLAWAKRTGIELDAKLVEAVEARGLQVADWKTLYDRVLEIAQNNKAIAEEAQRRVVELEALLRDREASATSKELGTRRTEYAA